MESSAARFFTKAILNTAMVISAVTLADGPLPPPHRGASTVGG